jgi:hypothetical protein
MMRHRQAYSMPGCCIAYLVGQEHGQRLINVVYLDRVRVRAEALACVHVGPLSMELRQQC